MKYLLLFLLPLTLPVEPSESKTYRVLYEVFDNNDHKLKLAEQLDGRAAETMLALHYIHMGAELVYKDGRSHWRYTGQNTYPEDTPVDKARFQIRDHQVWKDHQQNSTLESNALYPGVCRYFANDNLADDWTITQEFQPFQEYLAQKAFLTDNPEVYAWFVPQIPLKDGPFNVSGLPGLIVDYVTKKTRYRMTSIEMITDDENFVVPTADCDRILNIEEYNEHSKSARF